jgi:predicted dehydrogenase
MKVGVIGCGGMGTTHYLSLKALSAQMDLEVVALADCRQEFLDKAAAQFENVRTYTYGMDLIENEQLDIVHICLPSYLHVSHAVAAMEKGMNVFVEKPVCLTREDAKKILDAERRTGVKAMVGQVVRSFEEYKYLKDVYDTGKYGKLKSIVMQRISGDVKWGFEDWFHDEQRSGSVVLDLHVHDLDFLRYMLGDPDKFDVKAAAFDSGMINQIITTYEFGNVFAAVEGVWDESHALSFEASFRACFEEGTLVFKGAHTPSLTVYKKDGTIETPELKPEYDVNSDAAGINISNLGPYYTEIKYFAECVRDNKPIEIAPISEGVKSVEFAIEEWEAAKKYVADHQ